MIVFILFLAALIIWLGNKRKTPYYSWLVGYLILLTITYAVRIFDAPTSIRYIFYGLCVAYTFVFSILPHIVSKETAKEFESQIKEYAELGEKRTDEFYASLENWDTVKSYMDSSQMYELSRDKDILNNNGIASFVKTAGITTLMVENENFERASQLLGIVPTSLEDESLDENIV